MPTYRFTGGDARDYFPPEIGHVEPGDERDFDEAPDSNWAPIGDDDPAPAADESDTEPAEPVADPE